MEYFQEKLNFIGESKARNRSLFNNTTPQKLGIALRIGNAPIVKDLGKLLKHSNTTIPSDLQVLFEQKDLYLIVHMIGAIRLEGSAKVDELQYNAEMIEVSGAQTLDLLPNTTFKELIKVNMDFQGSISSQGNFSTSLPEVLSNQSITLGGDMKIQLSTDTNFIGKFTYSLKFPVVQSLGIASTSCTWILNPQATPLLGDQLLIQTIAVPKGCQKLTYKAKGVCKADKGFLWKQEVMETEEYKIEIDLL